MDIQDIVNTISNEVDIDPTTTEKVVGIILSVLDHETDGTTAASLFAKIPGAAQLARQYDVMAAAPAAGGGLLGSLESALGGTLGEKTGALVNGIAQLRASGLDMDRIRQAGSSLIQQAEAAAGPQLTNRLLSQVPSLKGQLGL